MSECAGSIRSGWDILQELDRNNNILATTLTMLQDGGPALRTAVDSVDTVTGNASSSKDFADVSAQLKSFMDSQEHIADVTRPGAIASLRLYQHAH